MSRVAAAGGAVPAAAGVRGPALPARPGPGDEVPVLPRRAGRPAGDGQGDRPRLHRPQVRRGVPAVRPFRKAARVSRLFGRLRAA